MPSAEQHPMNPAYQESVMPPLDSMTENFRSGIEYAVKNSEFNLSTSLQYDHPELSDSELRAREENIEKTAVEMASEAGLDAKFFSDTTNVVLLSAIADSWISNEERAEAQPFDERMAREREMLTDVLLMLAAENSEYLKDLKSTNPELASRYLPMEDGPKDKDRVEFFASISNEPLAQEVEKIFQNTGEGSFLEAQREMLGIQGDNERPFRVRVLDVGDKYELKSAGVLTDISWPELRRNATALELYEYKLKSSLAMKKHALQEEYVQPFKDNQEKYEKEYIDSYGEIPAAFVRFDSGEVPTLTLRAPEAHLILNLMNGKKTGIKDPVELERRLAIIRHEYAHTQKYLHRGENVQLGLNLEERKAELASGDKQGYMDVKFMFTVLSQATGVKLPELMRESLREEDALGTFLSKSAKNIGLRNTLLLMATKPLPYDSNPAHAKEFAQLGCLVKDGDGSPLDIAIRETLLRHGDKSMKEMLHRWTEANSDMDTDFVLNQFIPYRQAHGVKRGNVYMREAVEKVAKNRGHDTSSREPR